jgi:hypothetical protein
MPERGATVLGQRWEVFAVVRTGDRVARAAERRDLGIEAVALGLALTRPSRVIDPPRGERDA